MVVNMYLNDWNFLDYCWIGRLKHQIKNGISYCQKGYWDLKTLSSHRVNCALYMKFGKINLENRYDINTELKYINLSIYHNTEKIRNNNGGVHSIFFFFY